MDTTSETIDYTLRFYVNQGQQSVDTLQDLRDRARFGLVFIGGRIWGRSPWWFREGSGTMTLTAGAGTLPADFANLGTQGGIYVANQPTLGPLAPVTRQVLYQNLEWNPTAQTYPSIYAMLGVSAAGLQTLLTYPVNSSPLTLDVKAYTKRKPDMIDRPISSSVTVALGAAGNLTGAYTYKITFYTASGETEVSAPSSVDVTTSITAAAQQLSLTGIPLSPCKSVVGRKVYRTAAGGTVYKLAATIADNTTTTLTDNVADGSLTTVAPTPTTATGTGMEVFPETFHETVFVQGLIAWMARAQGDVRDNKWFDEFDKEIVRMWANEKQGQNAPQTLPKYGAGATTGSIRPRWLPG